MAVLPAKTNKLIGKALAEYGMIEDGDRILIAVSGGVDSLVLASILNLWRPKAPIDFELHCVHLDMGFAGVDVQPLVAAELEKTGLSTEIISTSLGPDAQNEATGNICYHCARNRRTKLFQLCKERRFTKLALGHHKEDSVETLFINMFYAGNISTMLPKQELFQGNLHIIRPLALLLKKDIMQLAKQFGYCPVKNPCPQSGTSKRDEIRQLLNNLYAKDDTLVHRLYSSMANVRPDYLLDKSLRDHLSQHPLPPT